MKIHYLSESRIPSRDANSVHVMKIASAMSVLGHDVTVFARRGAESITDDVMRYYGVAGRFHIKYVNWRPIRVVGGLSYALQVRRASRQLGLPDLYYGRHWASVLAVAGDGVPTRFEVHAPPEGFVQAALIRHAIRAGKLSRIVAISDALRLEYLRLFPEVPREMITVAHDASDPFPQNARPSALPGRAEAYKVGYVGHLYPGKGMEVISRLALRLPDIDFHVVGGTDRDIARWREKSVPNLIFHGHQPPACLPSLLTSFNLVLAPYQRKVSVSRGGDVSRWMSPLKLFEYMSAARTIVASDLPVLREILQHDVNGLLCPPNDMEAWVHAIGRCRDDRIFANRLGMQAKEDFLQRHTWIERARQVLQ